MINPARTPLALFDQRSMVQFGATLWPGNRAMARVVCGACGGAGSKREQVRRRDTCGRCGGSGQQRTGKVTVPCSGCGGKGGVDRTSWIQVGCRTCGGKGYR